MHVEMLEVELDLELEVVEVELDVEVEVEVLFPRDMDERCISVAEDGVWQAVDGRWISGGTSIYKLVTSTLLP